jgi:hypothetical protein
MRIRLIAFRGGIMPRAAAKEKAGRLSGVAARLNGRAARLCGCAASL